MTDANVNALGQINQSGDELALFLKIFSGEVLTIFEQKTITDGRHYVRNISNGKEAQFPLVGNIGSEYHTPGTEILGKNVNHAEETISLDGLLISHAFLAQLWELINHYDVRGKYSAKMGEELANVYDMNVLRQIVLGARADNSLDDGDGGTEIENSDLDASDRNDRAEAFIDSLFSAAEEMDGKNIPDNPRYCVLKPGDYYDLVRYMSSNGFSLVHRDIGGRGSIAEGEVPRVAGIDLLKSNNVPDSDYADTTDGGLADDRHDVDASLTKGVIWHPEGCGTVKLMDLGTEAEWDIRRQGYLMIAKMAVGHKYLRPECCVELKTTE